VAQPPFPGPFQPAQPPPSSPSFPPVQPTPAFPPSWAARAPAQLPHRASPAPSRTPGPACARDALPAQLHPARDPSPACARDAPLGPGFTPARPASARGPAGVRCAHAARGAPVAATARGGRAPGRRKHCISSPKRLCAVFSPTTPPKLNRPGFLRSFSPTVASPRHDLAVDRRWSRPACAGLALLETSPSPR
jgi:hypothetical protein